MTVSAELPPRKGLRVWDMIRVSFRVVGNFSSGDIVLEPFRTSFKTLISKKTTTYSGYQK